MVERMVRIHEVRGSIPLISTSEKKEYLHDTLSFHIINFRQIFFGRDYYDFC